MEINKPIVIIVILAISLTVIFLFALPKYQESQDLEVDLAQKRVQYEARLDYYLKLSNILRDIRQKQDVINKVESALPSDFDLASVVYFISQKAQESGLKIDSLTFAGQQKDLNQKSEQKIRKTVFKAELNGSYQQLKNFLSSLENSARLFEVGSISFISSPVQTQAGGLQSNNFNVEIETHTY